MTNNNPKPRRVKCKIIRIVTEIVYAILDKDGNVEKVEEVQDEQDYEVTELHSILSILSVYP